jgi:hypothetical protein
MFDLPKTKIKAERKDPKTIILFSKPKVGKSSAVAALDNCLIIDVEDGTNFIDALKINVLKIAKDNKITPITALKQVINKIQEENEKAGKFIYKYGAIDTITALEELSIELANNLYKKSPMGRNYTGNNVLELPNGSGYYWARMALNMILDDLQKCFETLIILGHTRDKVIEINGEELNERGLDLAGKTAAILCSQVDAIGYMYRDENKTIINFQPSTSLVTGSRSEHLKNKKITLIQENPDGTLKIDWSEIFID